MIFCPITEAQEVIHQKTKKGISISTVHSDLYIWTFSSFCTTAKFSPNISCTTVIPPPTGEGQENVPVFTFVSMGFLFLHQKYSSAGSKISRGFTSCLSMLCGASSRNLLEEKSKTPLFPVDGGTVATNDCTSIHVYKVYYMIGK